MSDTKDEFKKLAQRMWQDVAGLPWEDQGFTQSEETKDAAMQHYVSATTDDLMALHDKSALPTVVQALDAKMEEDPNRELADATNFLQELLNKEDK